MTSDFPQAGSPQLPLPTKERIAACLKAKGYHYFIDSDGDVGGRWENNTFYFFLIGDRNEVLHVRGTWSQRLPMAYRGQLLTVLDEWHRDRTWPKGYTVERGDEVEVCSEVSVDLEQGVTDAQLGAMIDFSVGPACSMFRMLGERFPSVVAPL